MRLSSLALSLLLLGSSPSFSAGIGDLQQERQEDRTRHKPYNLKGDEGHVLIDIRVKFTPAQFYEFQSQFDKFMESQSQLLSLAESTQVAQATQESLESHQMHFSETKETEYTKKVRKLLGQETFKVESQDADPNFFDALSDVVEAEPELCANIRHIQISLKPEQDYTKSHYELPTVLNYFIDQTQPESLSLSNFQPKTLYSCLASLSSKKSLKTVSFLNNSLDVKWFRLIVERLPYVTLNFADFSRNKIYGIERLTSMLPTINIKNLKILDQMDDEVRSQKHDSTKKLDLDIGYILSQARKYDTSLEQIV